MTNAYEKPESILPEHDYLKRLFTDDTSPNPVQDFAITQTPRFVMSDLEQAGIISHQGLPEKCSEHRKNPSQNRM